MYCKMKALNCNRLLEGFGSAGRLFHTRLTCSDKNICARRRGFDAGTIYTRDRE